jgi:hypothetical protein
MFIDINYNDKEYINFLVNRFSTESKDNDDLNDKIDCPLLYLKILNQLQVNSETPLQAKDSAAKMKQHLRNEFLLIP